MSEENVKRSKWKIILIIAIVVLLIIAGAGYFVYNSYKNPTATGTEWGDLYYRALLSDSKEHNVTVLTEDGNEENQTVDYFKNTKNVDISFVEIDKEIEPVMVTEFERDTGKKAVYVYSIDENSNPQYASQYNTYPDIDMDFNLMESDSDYDVVFLYNIEASEYRWYVHEKNDRSEVFKDLLMEVADRNMSIEKIETTETLKASYTFTTEEMKMNQTDENGVPILSKFEQTFIVPDNTETEKISVGDIRNIDEGKLKNNMQDIISSYKDIDSIVTEEVKLATETKTKELEEKQEQIKVAEEEKAKKEAEEKAKAEEEARIAEEEAKKKAEEEAAKVLKVGNYTLKYGKYTGDNYEGGSDRGPSGTATYTINADGTYTYSTTNGSKKSGTYKVKDLSSLGYYTIMYGLEFNDGSMIGVRGNNTLEALAGAGEQYKYQGK